LTYTARGHQRPLAVSGGFAEVRNDTVIILADTAERPEEIDPARAERARQRAEQRLAGRAQGAIDYRRAAAALARAQTRLQVASRASGSRPPSSDLTAPLSRQDCTGSLSV